MKIEQQREPYHTYLRDTLRLAPGTVAAYLSKVKLFSAWLGADADVGAITLTTLNQFKTLYEAGHRPRSVNSFVIALRSFCAWCIAQGYLMENPAAAVALVRLDRPERYVPSSEEVTGLLTACNRYADPLRSAMARAVVTILVYAGLRRAELLALRLPDVNLTEGSLFVAHGKGDRARKAFPAWECIAAIKAYMALRPGDCEHDHLFLNLGHRPLGIQGLTRLLRELAAMSDNADPSHCLPHCLRHAFATRLLQNGANIKDVSVALGHSSIVTTALYVHADEHRLAAIRHLTGFKEAAPVPNATPQTPAPIPSPQQPTEQAPHAFLRDKHDPRSKSVPPPRRSYRRFPRGE